MALFTKDSPEWTYVYNTASTDPAPSPRWVTGTVVSGNAAFQAVHVAGGDLPMGHDAYDFNVNILPDSQYTFLMGGNPTDKTGNYAGRGEEAGRLHTEWEDRTIPKFAWPEPGDRITELGSWVWDCGHWGVPTDLFSPDYLLPKEGQPCLGFPDPSQCHVTGESTEFHPYRALWDVRAQSSSSPYGEAQGELFISTDKTEAGKEADCAHKHPASNPAAYPPEYRACLQTEPNWQDVSGDYSFLLPAPPRPSAQANLRFRAVDEGSSGSPQPTLMQEGNAVRVTFHLSTSPSQRLVMAYRIFAGWDQLPISSVPVHLHVTLDKLEVHRAMDPGCPLGVPITDACHLESTRATQLTTAPGEWNLYWDFTGVWGQWGNTEFDPNTGDVITGSDSADIYVPPGSGWRLFAHGRECDLGSLFMSSNGMPSSDCPNDKAELADDNDVQGMILDVYPSVAASLGQHRSNALTHKDDPTSTCPDSNPEGCYSLTYTVTLIDDAASRVLNGNSALPEFVPVAGLGFAAGATALTIALSRRRRRFSS
jgi:hypothetical protein